MADMLQRGLDWLAGKRKAHAGTSVVYSRGATSATLTATLAKSMLSVTDEFGRRIEWADQDFLITAADLAAAGFGEPQQGDQLRLTVGDETVVFEALPVGSEPAWRWSDEHRLAVRIHGKEVARE